MTVCDENGNPVTELVPLDDFCALCDSSLRTPGGGGCGGKCGSAAAVEAVLAFAREQKLAATDTALLLNSLPR